MVIITKKKENPDTGKKMHGLAFGILSLETNDITSFLILLK